MYKVVVGFGLGFFWALNLWAIPPVIQAQAKAGILGASQQWTFVGSKRFSILQSLDRGQGITNDGAGHFYFAANQKLIRTKADYTTIEEHNSSPFTAELRRINANHIGDIDYFEGKIYAPIEDGRAYKHPVLAVYNAQTLQLETFAEVATNWQPDGVPWVAVDKEKKQLISAQYSNTTRINIYDMQTFKQVKQVELSHMISSIQGGKVRNGFLYMTANNDKPNSFALYKMNLQDGQIEKVFVMDSAVTEIEGLTFETRGTEEILHILGIVGKGLGRRIVLFDYKKAN